VEHAEALLHECSENAAREVVERADRQARARPFGYFQFSHVWFSFLRYAGWVDEETKET
jgi:hypothetical protein